MRIHQSLRHLLLTLLAALMLGIAGAFSPYLTAQAPQTVPPPAPASLWLDLNIQPALIPWFNAVAQPGDMARADQFSQVIWLNDVTTEPKVIVFKSVALAEQMVPRLAGKLQVLGYNLEHGPIYPADEQADPVDSIQRMRALADRYGLQLAFGPDHDFALSHGVAMAPYADIFVMQVQRVQTQPDEVHEFVVPLAAGVRTANPEIATAIQIRTEGDVNALAQLVASLRESIDGVSILTSGQTTDVAQALVAALRPGTSPAAQAGEAVASNHWSSDAFIPLSDPRLLTGLALGVVLGILLGIFIPRWWDGLPNR